MAKTREIRGRIKAVNNIQRITKTMQMIATARFQAAQRRATQAQPYTRKIAELVGELAGSAAHGAISHPLLAAPQPRTNRVLLLVLTSNRGLCGAYNANVLRKSTQFIREHDDVQIDVEVVGKKAVSYFRFAGIDIREFHSQFGENPQYEQVQQLAERYMDTFAKGEYDAIYVTYMAFQSMSRQSPQVLKLLPLEQPQAEQTSEQADVQADAEVEYEFSPEPAELISTLLPITVKTQLFQCFNEAVVSEQIARMVAMKSATDAASKMSKSLNRQFNRARQAAITTELSEIIAGAAALD